MVASEKTKKTHESINNRLALVMKSRKYTMGYETVLKSLGSSKDMISQMSLFLGQAPLLIRWKELPMKMEELLAFGIPLLMQAIICK
ncbi:60S ribosomal protein L30, variant 2 [Trifolium repens]|nr:60S ribosomal protein L30, variant 2 [Trifolium repens]